MPEETGSTAAWFLAQPGLFGQFFSLGEEKKKDPFQKILGDHALDGPLHLSVGILWSESPGTTLSSSSLLFPFSSLSSPSLCWPSPTDHVFSDQAHSWALGIGDVTDTVPWGK